MIEPQETASSARNEAAMFFRMTKRGEPAEELRLTIQPAPGANDLNAKYRLNVLELFESFVAAGKVVRAPVSRKKKRVPHGAGSSVNQVGILTAIRRGEVRKEIAKKFKVSTAIVSHIAIDNGLRCKGSRSRDGHGRAEGIHSRANCRIEPSPSGRRERSRSCLATWR